VQRPAETGIERQKAYRRTASGGDGDRIRRYDDRGPLRMVERTVGAMGEPSTPRGKHGA
jgi:hypothetical protein